MQLTIDQLAAACGAQRTRAALMFPGLNEALAEFPINTPARVGMFLANVGHETCRLLYLSELWGPTPQQRRYERNFAAPWPSSPADARLDRFMANALAYRLGNDSAGDGKRYAGHGFLQNTGKTNHRLATERLRARLPHLTVPDFVMTPSQLATSEWGWMAAAEYAERVGCLEAADRGDFDAFCDLINLGRETVKVGDSNGFPERLGLWAGIQQASVFA
jgi:putative chitinase